MASSSQIPAVEANPFQMDREQRLRYMDHFDVEYWQDALEGLTPKSYFLTLSVEEVEALVADYRTCWNLGPQESRDLQPRLSSLQGLRGRLDAALAALPKSGDRPSAFVRLSTRSPKDAGLCETCPGAIEALMRTLQEEAQRIQGNPGPNEQLKAAMRACGEIMEVRTAEDALALLRHSERTFTDMNRALRVKSERWALSLILREWKGFDLEHEFRGVVCNRRLCSLLQYNDMAFYPDLSARVPRLTHAVSVFFETLAPRLPFAHCIADFHAKELCNGSWEVFLVELNPHGPTTGIPFTGWSGQRRLLQAGVDVWGDLAEDEPAPGEGSWFETRTVEGLTVRVASGPCPQVTADYVEALAPIVPMALRRLWLEAEAGVPDIPSSHRPRCCLQ